VQAAFFAFEDDGNGVITLPEMIKFMSAVFKVVITPTVAAHLRSVGLPFESCDEMAASTAIECFTAADKNRDGKVSYQEFSNWINAPKKPADVKGL
jgi:Ca2+-binding EF-hand superfamily protein